MNFNSIFFKSQARANLFRKVYFNKGKIIEKGILVIAVVNMVIYKEFAPKGKQKQKLKSEQKITKEIVQLWKDPRSAIRDN